MLTKEEEYHAKYITLASWAADRTGLTSDEILEVVDEAYDKHMKPDLEEYCKKLYDGEDMNDE